MVNIHANTNYWPHFYYFTPTSDISEKWISTYYHKEHRYKNLKKKGEKIHNMGNIIVSITHRLFLYFCIQNFNQYWFPVPISQEPVACWCWLQSARCGKEIRNVWCYTLSRQGKTLHLISVVKILCFDSRSSLVAQWVFALHVTRLLQAGNFLKCFVFVFLNFVFVFFLCNATVLSRRLPAGNS